VPGADEVLIRVAYAGVNRPDVLQRSGNYPPPPGASPYLGLEVSGEVVATGRGRARWKAGDQVCALTNGGGYAEYVRGARRPGAAGAAGCRCCRPRRCPRPTSPSGPTCSSAAG
jgi:NADPH:quinone reductase-like Zn-dependent oxidoreductase